MRKSKSQLTEYQILNPKPCQTQVCEGSNLQAVIEFDKVPKIAAVDEYLESGCIPGGTNRNWASYGHKIGVLTDRQKYILADPQTSGGLLIAVYTDDDAAFEGILRENGIDENCIAAIGWLENKDGGDLISVV